MAVPSSSSFLKWAFPYETDLRMLVVENYIALYRIETETVSVGRIINARQDYIRILLGEVTP